MCTAFAYLNVESSPATGGHHSRRLHMFASAEFHTGFHPRGNLCLQLDSNVLTTKPRKGPIFCFFAPAYSIVQFYKTWKKKKNWPPEVWALLWGVFLICASCLGLAEPLACGLTHLPDAQMGPRLDSTGTQTQPRGVSALLPTGPYKRQEASLHIVASRK